MKCQHCGYGSQQYHWPSYVCPYCGRINERLYRAEHEEPEIGARLTIAEIEAEYRADDLPIIPIQLLRSHQRRIRELRRSS